MRGNVVDGAQLVVHVHDADQHRILAQLPRPALSGWTIPPLSGRRHG
jgi:hypothetical protein